MKLKTVKQIKSLKGKRVLLRLDLNVPVKANTNYQDNWRLLKVLPTIEYLVSKGAAIIIVAHLGRPQGKIVKKLSLKPVANYLAKLTGRRIDLWQKKLTDYVKLSKELLPGQIVMLENIRFHQGEQTGSKSFAKQLASLGDIYVNDAFGNIHRPDVSMYGITYHLPSYAGLLLAEEVSQLNKVLNTKQGLVVVLGGAKISTKIGLIKKFSKQADQILLGGGLANTLLAAQGYNLGKSLVDNEQLTLAKKLIKDKVKLPLDLTVAKSLNSKVINTITPDKLASDDLALDIGSQTVNYYLQFLKKAKIIVWNGPLGYFENPLFAQSSLTLAKKLVNLPAKVIIGGGETVELIGQAGLRNKYYFVSTGGGAMLSFLENNKLPVLERLK